MKHSQLLLTLLLFIILLSFGCAHNAKKAGPVVQQLPEWYGKQLDEQSVCAYGSAVKASEIASLDVAKVDAWSNAVKLVEAEVTKMLTNYEEEAGIKDPQVLALTDKIVKVVSNTRFPSAITGKTYTELALTPEGERFKSYLQLMITKAEIMKYLIQEIRNEDVLMEQLQTSPTFKELNENTK